MKETRFHGKIHRIEELIAENFDELRRVTQLKDSMKISAMGGEVCVSPENDAAYTRAVERYEELIGIILADNDRLAKTLSEITLAINKVEDEEYRLILKKSIIQNKTQARIAEEMNYCEKTISRKYDEALRELERTFEDVRRCP